MKNKIFALIAFAAIFAGCSKEIAQVEPSEDGYSTFSISASICDQDTKLSYTEQEDGSFKAAFNANDQIKLFFVKSDKTVAKSAVLAIDPYTISTDGRKAVFNVTGLTLPSDYEKVVAYMTSSNAALAFKDSLGTVDLSSQKTIAEANNRHVVCGSINKTDIKSAEPGKLFADVKMSYKTSLLRLKLTFPVRPALTSEVVLRSASGKLHSSVSSIWGDIDATSKAGEITVLPSSVDTINNTLTALACVWASDDLSDLFVSVKVEDLYYGGDLKLKKTTLEAGKVYDVPRTVKALAAPADIWTNDEAGSETYASADGEEVTVDFLSCKNNVVSWTANTTGKPRTATLTFKNGGKFTLTQIEAKDFYGDWEFTTKQFKPNTNPAVLPVKIAAAVRGYALDYTNDISISGLYETAVIDACVDISYKSRWAKVGLFLDTRDGEGQLVGNNYVFFFPGLGYPTATGWGYRSNSYYIYDQGNPDYSWMWFTVSSDFNQFTYLNRTSSEVTLQTVPQYPDATMNSIVGFGLLSSATNTCNAESGITTYTTFFQLNPDKQVGEFFTRK